MKIYKTYFDKSDTPYRQDFQPNKKYHVVWKRLAYRDYLGHKVVKCKLFGLIPMSRKIRTFIPEKAMAKRFGIPEKEIDAILKGE